MQVSINPPAWHPRYQQNCIDEANGVEVMAEGYHGDYRQPEYHAPFEENEMKDDGLDPAPFITTLYTPTGGSDPYNTDISEYDTEKEVISDSITRINEFDDEETEIHIYKLVKIIRPKRIIIDTEIIDLENPVEQVDTKKVYKPELPEL